jgi:large subunit ribosomal protein L25
MISFKPMTVILPIENRTKKLINNDNSVQYISAVVYGPKFASTAIKVERKVFEKTFKLAGESTIIELQGLETPIEVLVKEVVFSPIKGGIMHVDFYALEKGKEITTHIPLHFINESPAEKTGAVVNKVLHEVEVVCKPKDLPAHLDVDLSLLVQVEDKIHVSDIVCPKGVKITQEAHDTVALAEAVAEELVEEVPEIAAADVPVEKKGKDEAVEA